MAKAHAVGVGQCSHAEIDRLNILQATMVAMQRAYACLDCPVDKVFVDGNRSPQLPVECEAVIKGDQKLACISAASIIAKVTRDRQMMILAEQYPQYHFDRHKGYGTNFTLKLCMLTVPVQYIDRVLRRLSKRLALVLGIRSNDKIIVVINERADSEMRLGGLWWCFL